MTTDNASAPLEGKTIFMSGGSRGVGLAITVRVARDGANVALVAKTDEPHPKLPGTIHTAAEDIREAGGQALPIVCDIRDADSVEEAVERAVEGEDAAKRFEDEGFDVRPHALDVTDEKTIDKARRYVEQEYGRLDVLINNAAIHYDTWQHATDADLEVVHEALKTNLLGPWRMAQAFLPLLRRSEHARIVNASSGAGSLANMGAGTPA